MALITFVSNRSKCYKSHMLANIRDPQHAYAPLLQLEKGSTLTEILLYAYTGLNFHDSILRLPTSLQYRHSMQLPFTL